MPSDAVADEEMVATLGPEAWPAPGADEIAARLDQPRHLHPLLRDQRVLAGIGRSWVDEILWRARLSPFKKGSELESGEIEALRDAFGVLGEAIDHYEEVVGPTVPDKMPMPFEVHRREGEPCPRCGEAIAAIHYADRITCYCPKEQTGGRVLADRRLSRLLK
jgi:formamidopyrimidine-DNA glycosylase